MNIAYGGTKEVSDKLIYWIKIGDQRCSIVYDPTALSNEKRYTVLESKLSALSFLKCILKDTISFKRVVDESDVKDYGMSLNQDMVCEMSTKNGRKFLNIRGIKVIDMLFKELSLQGLNSFEDVKLYDFLSDPLRYTSKIEKSTLLEESIYAMIYASKFHLFNMGDIDKKDKWEETSQFFNKHFSPKIKSIIAFMFKYSNNDSLKGVSDVFLKDSKINNVDINKVYWIQSDSLYRYMRIFQILVTEKNTKKNINFRWGEAMKAYLADNKNINIITGLQSDKIFDNLRISDSSIEVPINKSNESVISTNIKYMEEYRNYIFNYVTSSLLDRNEKEVVNLFKKNNSSFIFKKKQEVYSTPRSDYRIVKDPNSYTIVDPANISLKKEKSTVKKGVKFGDVTEESIDGAGKKKETLSNILSSVLSRIS